MALNVARRHRRAILALEGDSYPLKDKHEEVIATEATRENPQSSTGAYRAVFDRR